MKTISYNGWACIFIVVNEYHSEWNSVAVLSNCICHVPSQDLSSLWCWYTGGGIDKCVSYCVASWLLLAYPLPWPYLLLPFNFELCE
eukprot:scaffold226_cov185-Alexandrium_tamarense.AAC.4